MVLDLTEKKHQFVDYLYQAEQTYWQILPLGPTSYGDSPYQTFSAFANNPYFISLEMLVIEGLLEKRRHRKKYEFSSLC